MGSLGGGWRWLCLVCIATCGSACSAARSLESSDAVDSPMLTGELDHVDGMLAPLPEGGAPAGMRVRLGARLFRDPRLSSDGRVACSSCHDLARGGANGEPRSTLPGRAPVAVNVPTVFNLAYDFRYSWSGKFVDVGRQLDVAMTLADAMNTTWDAAAERLERDATYVREFGRAYRDGLTAETIRDALIRYDLSLTTPNARFDRFLLGELELDAREQRGYAMFREYGCVSCHQGVNVGGNLFQRFGVMRDYFAERGDLTDADLGLYNETQLERDRHVFRVPSLRNVALTAPYFHDGSAPTLHHAVQTMARYQLGRELTNAQAADIVAFLETLTGTYQGAPE